MENIKKENIEQKDPESFKSNKSCWLYNEKVKQHFFEPKNAFRNDKEVKRFKADGIGLVGSPACGDGMKMFIKIENKKGKDEKDKEVIVDVKWLTFGCATAIASTSIFSEMIKGKTIEEALKITAKDIADALGGLPARKFHCSVLADQAFKAAVEDFRKK